MVFWKKFLAFLCFGCVFLLNGGLALALELRYPTILGFSINDTSKFPEYARYFFNIGIALAGIISVGVLAFGGIYYLIDFARGRFRDEGKEWIKAGITGLLIVMCSYLIVFTINPSLTIFKLDNLKQINFNPLNPVTPTPNHRTTTFNAIPIGNLVETLLTKKIGCYAFDDNGNPIKGERMEAQPCQDATCSTIAPNAQSEEFDAPTFLKNDRVECILNLEAGIKAKLKKIREEIISPLIDLMDNNCACSGDTADADSAFNKEYFIAGIIAKTDKSEDPTKCDSNCNLDDPCDTSSDADGKCGEGENEDKKAGDPCDGDCKEKACKPADKSGKLCCQNPDDTKKQIEDMLKLLKSDPSHDEYLNQLTTSYKYGNDDGYLSVIDLGIWGEFNLWEQYNILVTMLNGKKSSVKSESKNLGNNATKLSNCYFAMSTVDLVNLAKQNNDNENLILVNGAPMSKYCKVFNYSNSSCYKRCQDMCPDSQDLTSCISDCPKCGGSDDSSDCLSRQSECMGSCLDQKPCPNSPFENLGECMNSCSSQCQENCQTIYSEDSDELTICQNLCLDNSKCLAENVSTCIFSQSSPDKCADTVQNHDAANLDYCINRSYYSCKYGSYQNAGYADCANGYGCAETSETYPPLLQSNLFSSSYLFQNSEKERCQNSIQQCFTDENVRKTCTDIYPETAKCPTLSNCPYCPCTSLESKEIKFTALAQKTGRCEDDNEYENKDSFTMTDYQIVGPECGEYSFNNDPLTFYCQQDWWNNDKEKRENPMGKERFCSKNSEIPVGNTIDDAQKWAAELVQKIDDFKDVLEKEFDTPLAIIQKHVEDEDYCECDSTMNKDACCVGNSCEQTPACFTNCNFADTAVTSTDEEGNETTTDKCACSLTPCSGQPCQQMIDPLTKMANAYNKLIEPYGELFAFYINDQRSEIFKELTYSREKINDCSVAANTHGTQVKIMGCGRIEDELIPPINTNMSTILNGKTIQNYCYGSKLGKLFNMNLNDNWFCCEVYNPEESESKSQ
jgi:hypothetical protein